MMDKIEITGMPIVKFKDRKTIESIRSGKIWFNPLTTYRKEEECNSDTVVGDKCEAMCPIRDAHFIIPKENRQEHIVNDYIKTKHMNDYVFCIFEMNIKDDYFEFTDLQKERLSEFGDTGLIITNQDEFFRRIKERLSEKHYEYKMDRVNYYNPDVDNLQLLLSLCEDMRNIAFWKRNDYSYQNELRMLISKEQKEEEHLEIDIGDISDISRIMETGKLLKVRLQKA